MTESSRPFRARSPLSTAYRGLRSLRSLNPRLTSFHASGVRGSAVVVTYRIVAQPSGKAVNATLKVDIHRSVARRVWNGYYESGPRPSAELPQLLREATAMLLGKYPPKN